MTIDKSTGMSEALLHGYVDGLLSDADRRRVEDYLGQNPDKAEEVAEWARQNAALGALFPARDSAVQLMPVPRAGRVMGAGGIPARLLQIAAVLALVGVGVAAGWFSRAAVDQNLTVVQTELVHEAIAAHSVYVSEVLHPVEVSASDEAHLVGWLSKRLGARIVAPDLSNSGFELMGGRLLPSGEGPAAQFMYEDSNGRRITVYASAGSPGALASFQFDDEGGVSGVYWQDENLQYAVVGSLPRDELTSLATAVYRQLI